MNNRDRPEDETPTGEIDCGEPLAELAMLREAPSSGFGKRVRQRIGRRRLTAEIAQVAVETPVLVLMEFLDLMYHFFTGKITGKGGSDRG